VSLLENLEILLETGFVEKGDNIGDEDDDSRKCIVCLTFELGSNIPERICECGAPYHNKCLYELFMNEFSTNIKRSVECPLWGMVSFLLHLLNE